MAEVEKGAYSSSFFSRVAPDGGLQPDGDPACDPTTRRRFSVWHYNRDCAAYREARPFSGEKTVAGKTFERANDSLLTRAAGIEIRSFQNPEVAPR